MSRILSDLLYMTIENTSSKTLELKSRKKILDEFQDFLNYNLKPMIIKKKDCFEPTILKQYISNNIKFDNNLIEQKFQKLFIETDSDEMEIDIKEIDTVANSKSRSWGYSFPDLYSFGKSIYIDGTHASDEAKDEEWSFEASLSHLSPSFNKTIETIKYSWNNRLMWLNSDGSHHLATLIFHAYNNKINQKVTAKTLTISINKDLGEEILEKYYLFVFNYENFYYINKFINTEKVYFSQKQYNGNCLLVIPKNINELDLHINLLIKFNSEFIFYLNPLLEKKLLNQSNLNK